MDKKPYKDFDIYYIGYITIKKIDEFRDHEIFLVEILYIYYFLLLQDILKKKMVKSI